MSVLTDLIYGGSHAVAGLTEGAVNDAIAKYGADHPIAFPDTAYFFPTIYAATGVKVKTLGDLPACVGVLKSLITDQEDLGQALNAGLATAVGAEILEGLKFAEPKDAYEQAAVPGIGFVPDPVIRSLGVPLVTGDIPGVAVVLVGILAVVSLFIIANTIKLATFYRREEIAIMKMCGATNAFIRWPFVVEGMILGLTGAVVAFFLQWGVYELVARAVIQSNGLSLLTILPFNSLIVDILPVFCGAGLLIGVVGSVLAIRKFLQV